jgi:hypothetical protein
MAKRRTWKKSLTESRLTADEMVDEGWQVGIGATGLVSMEDRCGWERVSMMNSVAVG